VAQTAELHGLKGYGGEATLPRNGLLERANATDGLPPPLSRKPLGIYKDN
jgi:hypothetical protein